MPGRRGPGTARQRNQGKTQPRSKGANRQTGKRGAVPQAGRRGAPAQPGKRGDAKPVRGGDQRPRTDAARGGGAAPGRGSERTRSKPDAVAGRNAVVEALRAGVPATALYVAEGLDGSGDRDDPVGEALRLARGRQVTVLRTGRHDLDRAAGGVPHQGLVLQVQPYEYAEPDDLPTSATGVPLIVALDGVTDPHNVGAVVRSAQAFGAHGVVLPERRAAGITPAAWKASAGAAATLPVARATNLTRQLTAYRKAGLFVVGLTNGPGSVEIGACDLLTEPLVLVTGAEGDGLSRLVAEACDQLVAIPTAGPTESLNASVATGVALYEIARRRAAPG